jgi:hypothetical protein
MVFVQFVALSVGQVFILLGVFLLMIMSVCLLLTLLALLLRFLPRPGYAVINAAPPGQFAHSFQAVAGLRIGGTFVPAATSPPPSLLSPPLIRSSGSLGGTSIGLRSAEARPCPAKLSAPMHKTGIPILLRSAFCS